MPKPDLAVVTDATPTKSPAKRKQQQPTTIKDAVACSERDLLAAMRRKVASEIDAGVPAHALAPLMRQLREIDKDIRALDARAEQEAAERGDAPDEPFDASAI